MLDVKRGFLNSKKAQSAFSLTSALKETEEEERRVLRTTYGVVEKTGPPEGYELTQLSVVDTDPNLSSSRTDVPYNLIFTTLPPVPMERNYVDFPDGFTECAVPPATKHLMITYPGFPTSLPRPTNPIPYEVRAAPGMGLGLYATRNIRSGELVIAERPLLLVSPMMGLEGRGHIPATASLEEYKQVLLAEKEQVLRFLFDRMLPEDQTAFMALANDHLHDGSGPIMGVIRTNGFGIDCYRLPEEKRKGEMFGHYTVVTRILSRANHSCEPTLSRDFNPATFSMNAWASRFIRKGEALTVTYCATRVPYAERQAELAPYGFMCECTKCLRERPGSARS